MAKAIEIVSELVDPNKPVNRDELSEVFRAAEKPAIEFRIGAEGEKFAVERATGRPLAYDGEFGVCRVFRSLSERYNWQPYREREGGPILALTNPTASITLEPGMQFELSGAPLRDLHAIDAELHEHFEQLAPISEEMGLVWLMTGFHPLAPRAALPWVPKERYPIMREYLPTKGSGALDMMQRTATVQANFDYSSERDAMRKLQVTLKLSPLIHAMFANSPFEEGKRSAFLSCRGEVWRHMDKSRSGLIPPLWKREPTYEDYIEWALDAGMFLFRRGDEFVKNTGQTFRDFMKSGFEGHHATLSDFKAHLATLFPEVRLKSTLEMRAIDSLQPPLMLAMIGVFTGIVYDAEALSAAEELASVITLEELEAARPRLLREGPKTTLFGRTGFDFAERLLEIARGGLSRRAYPSAAGLDETTFLRPIEALVELRMTPAETALEMQNRGASILEATELQFAT